MRRIAPFVVVALAMFAASAAPGCTSGIGLASPLSMNRPVDVAFACFDTSIANSPQVVPLVNCALFVDVSSNTRQPPANPGFHMHALVTQSTRGEVGAVDLIARGVLDSDMSVPGYTFVPVGELPTQIIVRPSDGGPAPVCTYVASRGPVDGRHPGISLVDTRRFRSGAGLDHNPFPTVAPYVLPAPPSDMVLSPDEQYLWVSMDALSVVVRIPILSSCQLGNIDLVVPLFEDVPAGVDVTVPTPTVPGNTADLTYQCGFADGIQPVRPQDPGPRAPDFDAFADPVPAALEIDRVTGVLLVADSALPLIHRIDMASGTLLPPIAPGAPVRDVAVTPFVPDSYALDLAPGNTVVPTAHTTFSRYLYAIDATDGTVMAIEYTDPASSGFGGVIPVDVQGARRPDRIAMPVVARQLEIVTPQYDTTAVDPRFPPPDAASRGNPYGYGLCLPSDPASTAPPSPTTLRGVFLVVTAADGSVRFVDVYDLDAPCRGRTFGGASISSFMSNGRPSGDCTAPTVTGDNDVYIRRHRPRVQQLLIAFVTVDTAPTVYLPAGGNIVLDENGSAGGTMMGADQDTPALSPLASCPAPLGVVFGNNVVCSMVDPFAAVSETWSATFEGQIPGTFTAGANAHRDATGRFDGHIFTRIDYCARGAIGSFDATAPQNPITDGGIDAQYQGDMLVLGGTIPEANLDTGPMSDMCRRIVGIENFGQTQLPILARVQRVFTNPIGTGIETPYIGQIDIDPMTPIEDRDGVLTIADAIDCYGDQLLTVELRSFHALTVSGTRSGFQHRVVREPTEGACVFHEDPALILHQGRALYGQPFLNTRIAFQPTGSNTRTSTNSLAEIRIVLTGGPSQLGLDLSLASTGVRTQSLPTGLRYSPEMWALYAIETERRGLVEMTMRPLSVTQTAYQ